jgi:hypothetical protein
VGYSRTPSALPFQSQDLMSCFSIFEKSKMAALTFRSLANGANLPGFVHFFDHAVYGNATDAVTSIFRKNIVGAFYPAIDSIFDNGKSAWEFPSCL